MIRLVAVSTCCLLGLATAAASHDFVRDARRAPLWNVSGRWDGINGAEYAVFRQRRNGALDITIHHTCAPGHIERGRGRIRGDRVTGRVAPASEPPPGCVHFATIDVRVDPKGRRMSGRYATDLGSGELIYLAKGRARSLVRFTPRIVRRASSNGRFDLFVRLRPRPSLPRGALARVRLCHLDLCIVRHGRYGPGFGQPRERCGRFVARVHFAGSNATTRRVLCT